MKTPKLKAVTVADLESLVRQLRPLIVDTVKEAVRDVLREEMKPKVSGL
jgi:hypothetical protein